VIYDGAAAYERHFAQNPDTCLNSNLAAVFSQSLHIRRSAKSVEPEAGHPFPTLVSNCREQTACQRFSLI
jgi:hypothetical protein